MTMGATHKEILTKTRKSKQKNRLVSRICLLYFVISYSAACLILMTNINCKDFVETALFLNFVLFMLFFLQMALTFELPLIKNKSQSKIVPQDCENGSISSIPKAQKSKSNIALSIISSGMYPIEKHSFNAIKISDDIAQLHILRLK